MTAFQAFKARMKVTPDKSLTLKIAWPCWGQGLSGEHKFWYNFSSLVGFNEGIILLHPYFKRKISEANVDVHIVSKAISCYLLRNILQGCYKKSRIERKPGPRMRLRMLQLACYRQIKKLQLVIVDTTSAPAQYIVGQ